MHQQSPAAEIMTIKSSLWEHWNVRKFWYVMAALASMLFLSIYIVQYYGVRTKFVRYNLSLQYAATYTKFKPCPRCANILRKLARRPGASYITTRLLNQILEPARQTKRDSKIKTEDVSATSNWDSTRITFIIMGSSVNKNRISSKRASYMKWPEANYLIFSDQPDNDLGMVTLPEIQGKADYKAAQFRQLYGMKYIVNNRSDIMQNSSWFILGDDDSWFNVPALTSFLSQYDPELLIAFGYLWVNTFVPGAIFSGGSGVVLSRAVLKIMAQNVLTPQCPFNTLNDMTLSDCFKKYGVIKVHDTRFHHDGPVNSLSKNIQLNDVISEFSFHYANDVNILRQITCYASSAWQMMAYGLDCLPYSPGLKDFIQSLKEAIQRMRRRKAA